MQKFKRFMAVALAATMVIGSSVTAFAEDDPYSSTGTGSNEGHVDKHVISVTLPTVPAGSTPFSYTVDPERLVTETNGARYGTTTFTNDAKSAGVYFLNGTPATAATYAEVTDTSGDPDSDTQYYTKDGTTYTATAKPLEEFASGTTYYTQTSAGTAASSSYDNKSGALTATSQSSADVELTVEVEVANNGNITLVDAAPSTDGYSPATVADEDAFVDGTYYTKSGNVYTKATEYDEEATYYEESDPELYLALMVGGTTTVLEAGETATKTVTIAGIDSNFETTYDSDDSEYKYTVKTTGLTDWNTSAFYLTGTASKSSAQNVTAPTLTVTWSYADPAADEGEQITPNEMSAASLSGTTLSCRLVSGENATAANVSSVKIGDSVVSSTSSASGMYYEVVSSGAIKIYNVSVNTGTVTIVHDGTTYQKTF